MQLCENESALNFETFINYLKEHLENYPKKTEEREIILLLFGLAYKKKPCKTVLFSHWDSHSYSQRYTPNEAIALCEKFIKYNLLLDLHLDMSFPEAIDVLKVAFLKQQPSS